MSGTNTREIDALARWCLRVLLGIGWCQFVRSGIEATQTHCYNLVAPAYRITRMDDNADAKRILLAFPPADW